MSRRLMSRIGRADMWPAIIAVLAVLTAADLAAQPLTTDAVTLSPARLADINRGLKALPPQSGRFEQIMPNGGLAEGTYHMDWPARLRFAYDDAHGGAIVTVKGKFVAVQETARAEPNWFPVSLTPLAVLRQAVETGIQPAMVVAASETQEQLSLTLRDPKGDLPGTATLYFTGPDWQLYAWRLVDVQNLVTQVRLSARSYPPALSDRIFDIDYDEADE